MTARIKSAEVLYAERRALAAIEYLAAVEARESLTMIGKALILRIAPAIAGPTTTPHVVRGGDGAA